MSDSYFCKINVPRISNSSPANVSVCVSGAGIIGEVGLWWGPARGYERWPAEVLHPPGDTLLAWTQRGVLQWENLQSWQRMKPSEPWHVDMAVYKLGARMGIPFVKGRWPYDQLSFTMEVSLVASQDVSSQTFPALLVAISQKAARISPERPLYCMEKYLHQTTDLCFSFQSSHIHVSNNCCHFDEFIMTTYKLIICEMIWTL